MQELYQSFFPNAIMKTKPNFNPQTYTLKKSDGFCLLEIKGQKLPPPSKRITLNQKNIKVQSAKIVQKHKKGDIEFNVIRINRIKSFGEVRLHTDSTLYPGTYVVTLEYTGELDEAKLGEKLI